MPRIVSLLPSLTEIVAALGRGDELVGRSHECDFPPGVERLPICTEPKLDASAPSRAIDDEVKRLVRDGLSIYRVKEEVLADLAADVVLTQDQCEVCAASIGDVESALARLGGLGGRRPEVVSVAPNTLGEVWASIGAVARGIGAEEEGRALVASLTDRLTELGEKTGALPRPRVACIEWIDPPMGAGHWMPELVALAGGEALFGETGRPSAWLEWSDLVAADPDAIVVLPCGYDRPRTRQELRPLAEREEWPALRAVRDGRVFLADGNQYFNRPGPRLVESVEILIEALHPEAGAFGHEGVGFERL